MFFYFSVNKGFNQETRKTYKISYMTGWRKRIIKILLFDFR